MKNIKLLDLLYEALNIAKIRFLDTGKIKKSIFDEFDSIDSTANKAYIEKMCEFYIKYEISKEDIIDVFSKVIQSKEDNPTKHKELKSDIFNKIKSKKDFEDLKDKILNFKYVNSELQQYRNMEGAEVVYEDNRFTVVRIDTEQAAIKLGKGTNWCVSKKTESMFDEFKDSTLYFIFDNSKPASNEESKFILSVTEDKKIGDIANKKQTFKGKEDSYYPKVYLTKTLGLKLNIFKWVKKKLDSYIILYKDGLTFAIIEEKFPWLLEDDVKIEHAIIGYKGNKLIWYDGFWSKGTWKDGIWKGGIFFENGIWEGGDWQGGEFRGKWKDPNNPKPLNVEEYKDGLTMDIITSKFPWLLEDDVDIKDAILGYDKSTKKLIWYSGNWISGTWEDGIWKGGIFFKNGIWEGGDWQGGEFNGKWKDPNNPKPLTVKEYKDSLTYNIIKEKFPWLLEDDVNFEDAIIGYDGNKLIWYNGIWKRGIWQDGTFENGYFFGTWKGGDWQGGSFKGKWEDPNNPKPLNVDEYRDGLTYNIIKEKFPWLLKKDIKVKAAIIGYDKASKKLIWYSGIWEKGTWEDGIWYQGWFNGTWKGGKWYRGYIHPDTKWEDSNTKRPVNDPNYIISF